MRGRNWWRALRSARPSASGPLLPAALRPAALAVVACCAAVTALLGILFNHQAHADSFDYAIDTRMQAALGSHYETLHLLVRLGGPVSVAQMTTVLALACITIRHWRAAALLAVGVSAASSLTGFVLKPFIDRTLAGGLSFPSGHSTGVFALACAVTVILIDPPRPRLPRLGRLAFGLGACLFACAVAVALVSLRIHYFTDTIAGAAVGIGVVLATALGIDLIAARRPSRPAAGSSADHVSGPVRLPLGS